MSVSDLLVAVIQAQRQFLEQLAAAMQAAGDGGALAVIGVSFLYGVFHAVGPGHGKLVVGAYAATQAAGLGRVLLLAGLSAAVQGAVAVGLVFFVVFALGLAASASQTLVRPLELASFAAVAGLGAFLALRAARGLWRDRARGGAAHPPHHGHDHDHGHDHGHACGHDHGHGVLTARDISPWTFVATAVAVGLRPCSGAILVLLLGLSLGVPWVAVAAVAAMSFGTGLTVGGLAGAAFGIREGIGRIGCAVLGARANGSGHALAAGRVVACLGGLLIAGFGTALLLTAMAPSHPLLLR